MNETSSVIAIVADRLEAAQKARQAISPVRESLGATNIDAAYEVQKELARRRIDRGALVTGRKIGLTSRAVQRQLGVDQPDFGILFGDMERLDGGTISIGHLIEPRIEAEVAFVLGSDLDGELNIDVIRSSVNFAVAALEIVDSRVVGWDIAISDTVADNGSSALYVLGSQRLKLMQFVPRDVTMSMRIDGAVVSQGIGTACLGDPLLALFWLACAAQEFGEPLRAGQVVLSGALGPMIPVTPGQQVSAEIMPLGTVSIEFSKE